LFLDKILYTILKIFPSPCRDLIDYFRESKGYRNLLSSAIFAIAINNSGIMMIAYKIAIKAQNPILTKIIDEFNVNIINRGN
jgi:hypothetical protein